MPYSDEIEQFQVEVLGLRSETEMDEWLIKTIRVAIEKWEEWTCSS